MIIKANRLQIGMVIWLPENKSVHMCPIINVVGPKDGEMAVVFGLNRWMVLGCDLTVDIVEDNLLSML
jgi:hypothetical protein